MVALIQLIQLIQEDRSIKLSIVSVAEAVYGLVDSILVLVLEQIHDFACPIHGFDGDFNSFGLIRGSMVRFDLMTFSMMPDDRFEYLFNGICDL